MLFSSIFDDTSALRRPETQKWQRSKPPQSFRDEAQKWKNLTLQLGVYSIYIWPSERGKMNWARPENSFTYFLF